MGMLTDHLCQVFNCFGNRTLILQPVALILPEEARELWQGSNGLAAVRMWSHTGESLCAHMCTETQAGTLTEDPCGNREHRFIRQKQAKTHREVNMLQIGAS